MRRLALAARRTVGLLLGLALLGLSVAASPDAAGAATVHTDSARPAATATTTAPSSSTSPPPLDTPPDGAANLLFTLLARGAVWDPVAGALTLEGASPVATFVSQTPVPHAGRLPATRLANASAWASNGAWLNGPHAVLEGTPEGGGRGPALVLRLSRPAVVAPPSASSLTLRFDARLADPDGAGALPGGVVAYALAGAAAADAAAMAGRPPPAASPGAPPPPPAPTPPARPLRLSDAALFIDASLSGVESPGQGGAKQVSPYYGCYSSSLGSLAVFGSNCGGSEDWQYDPFTAGGSQYVG